MAALENIQMLVSRARSCYNKFFKCGNDFGIGWEAKAGRISRNLTEKAKICPSGASVVLIELNATEALWAQERLLSMPPTLTIYRLLDEEPCP